jgi:hypothetical protein
LINVDINMILVLPANVKGPVPVLMMFGLPNFPAPAQPLPAEMDKLNAAFKDMMVKYDTSLKAIFEKYPVYSPITRLAGPNFFALPAMENLSPTELLLASGWGYATIDPNSIQADNGAGLTKGIIGLVNKGKPRKPDDWGALRAWGWGVSRLIDYFEATPDARVDPKKVGIEGVSRYGKAAIVAQAFDERVAVAFVASSGEGGVKLHRHIYGEALENLTGGEYYWMAGNLIKYGASDAAGGPKTAADLPVDSHQLIALCAPRPCFISYGVPSAGDPAWVDAHGSFMAGVLAGPVYRLLGKHDFGTPGDYLTDPMPPVGKLIGGELAWRQHEGGHTAGPNFPAFFEWVSAYIKAPALPQAQTGAN